MANPSSTSSKRLVGLGLRGLRNSPPTQMTPQLKSVLSQNSPRTKTSPTMPSSSASLSTITNTSPNHNQPAAPAAFASSISAPSLASAATKVVSPNPKLRSSRAGAGTVSSTRLHSPHAQVPLGVGGSPPHSPPGCGTDIGAGGGAVKASRGIGTRTRSSPLIESFTPSSLDMTMPASVSVNGQVAAKGFARSGAGFNSGVNDVTGVGAVVKNVGDVSQRRVRMVDGSAPGLGKLESPVSFSGGNSGGNSDGVGEVASENGTTSPGGGRISTDNSGKLADDHDRSLDIRIKPEEQRSSQSPLSKPTMKSQSQLPPNPQAPIHNNVQPQGLPQSGLEPEPEPHHYQPQLGHRVGGGFSSHSTFVDVPFPLHPEKTFRIHTSPLAGSPLLVVNPLPSTVFPSDVAATSPLVVPLPTSTSCPFPAPSSTGSPLLKASTSVFPGILCSSSTARPLTRSRSVKFDDSPTLSPNSKKRLFTPINEDMYKSPPQIEMSPSIYSSSSRSPSSSMLLLSRVHLLRQSEVDDEMDGMRERGREQNYSMICSPSSSPLLSGRGQSRSPSASPSRRGRSRSGYGSPVAKIETVLGPRERGIECIPEKRDYQYLYSRLRQMSSPGSLTPLEEDKSLDLGAILGYPSDSAPQDSEAEMMGLPIQMESLSLGGNEGRLASSRLFSGLPVTSVTGAGSRVGLAFGSGTNLRSGSGTESSASVSMKRTIPSTRVGLRRKATGVGSPLANCVATWESLSNDREDGVGDYAMDEDEGDDQEMPMSPVLMHVKDSLLLKDVQKRKRRKTVTDSDPDSDRTQLLDQPSAGISASTSAPPRSGSGWSSASPCPPMADAIPETQSLLSEPSSYSPSPDPSRAPSRSRSTPQTDFQALSPLTLATQIKLPDTPTIGPCTKTAFGSRDLELEEVISPLQLSSPTIPIGAAMMDSAWVQRSVPVENACFA